LREYQIPRRKKFPAEEDDFELTLKDRAYFVKSKFVRIIMILLSM